MKRFIYTFVVTIVLASVLTTAAAAAKPETTSPPTIEGKPVVGQGLSAGNGLWRNSPTSFGYQWVRCDAKGGSCTRLSGQTERAYTVTNADLERTLVVLVTATNADGFSTANSKPSAVITPAAAPTNKTAPSISGRPALGAQLVADPGEYSGGAADKFSFQWKRCNNTGGQCENISGAIGQGYGVRTADVDQTLRVEVKATNEYGTTTSESKATAVVTAQPVAPVAITTTLTASRNETTCCQSVRLSGTVSTGKAGEPITILAREFDDIIDYPIAQTTTNATGNWSVQITPQIQTRYSVQTSTTNRQGVTVRVHPRVGLGVSGNNFSAKVTARSSFGGRIARFQTRTGAGGWRTVQLVVINLQSVARFHVSLPRGRTYQVRIYLPRGQAGAGYLDGTSSIRRVGGTA